MKSKVISVISSCRTEEQLHTAHRYMLLAVRNKMLNASDIVEIIGVLRNRRLEMLQNG